MNKKLVFKDKVVWITGASSGIGEALVYEFAGLGARMIASSNDPEGLERMKNNCVRPEAVSCVHFDLSDTSGINEIVENQIEIFGQIDYLLNIGGISQRSRIEETPLWLDRRIFEINYFGTFRCDGEVGHHQINLACFQIFHTVCRFCDDPFDFGRVP